MGKTALIAGATGLVGSELLQLLLQSNEYSKVVALVRRPLQIEHARLEQLVCDFERLEEVKESFSVDDVFCCLGTTIKKAKTKEKMYRVDVEYPLSIARLAQEMGAKHYLVISSMNANPNSSIWYSKMKGQLEEQLKEIAFPALSIVRPALLVGEREEFRLGERMAIQFVSLLSKIAGRPVSAKMAIEARKVAIAMFNLAQHSVVGAYTYSSEKLYQLSNVEKK